MRGKIGKAKGVCKVSGETVSEAEVTFMLFASPERSGNCYGSEAMIHPTAVIHPKAQIGADCVIGPYCVIGENVTLGDRCRLHSHVVIDGHTTLGEDNEIFPFASIGLKTQDLKWKGGLTRTRDRQPQHLPRIRHHPQRHRRRRGDDRRFAQSHPGLRHIAHNVHVGQPRHHVQRGHAGRAYRGGGPRRHGRAGGGASVLPHRQDVHHRRLLQSRAGRAPLHAGRRQPGRDAHHQQSRPGAQRRFRGGPSGACARPTRSCSATGSPSSNALAQIEDDLPPLPELKHLVEFVRASERGITR